MHELNEIDFNLATREILQFNRFLGKWPGFVSAANRTDLGWWCGSKPVKSIEIPHFEGTNIHTDSVIKHGSGKSPVHGGFDRKIIFGWSIFQHAMFDYRKEKLMNFDVDDDRFVCTLSLGARWTMRRPCEGWTGFERLSRHHFFACLVGIYCPPHDSYSIIP